jgi:hypothetical protein
MAFFSGKGLPRLIFPFVWEQRALCGCFGAGLIILLIGAVRDL